MRQPRRDKQRMFYSLFTDSTIEYETDENGNIIYTEVDGEQVPVTVGEIKSHFAEPVEFKSSINSQLNALRMRAWGVDQSGIWSEILVRKGYLPIKIGSLVWRENPIEWEDEANRVPLASSADYTVMGIMTEDLYTDAYLLQRNSASNETDV